MKNTPLEVFICTQIDNCKLNCIQKVEQLKRPDYVKEQQKKMVSKIHVITHNNNNGNNGKKNKIKYKNKNS
jgi:hypothetical protein